MLCVQETKKGSQLLAEVGVLFQCIRYNTMGEEHPLSHRPSVYIFVESPYFTTVTSHAQKLNVISKKRENICSLIPLLQDLKLALLNQISLDFVQISCSSHGFA